MNRREWLSFVAATVPLLCLPAPVVGAVAPPPTKHPHDALLHRLGFVDAKPQLIRFVSVQHGKLVDADFTQLAPFYDRVLTFWHDESRMYAAVVLEEHTLTAESAVKGTTSHVVAEFPCPSDWLFATWEPNPSDLAMTPTPEHPHAAWMRQHLGVDSAVLVSLEEHSCCIPDQTVRVITTVWQDQSYDKNHMIVQVGNQFNAGYFDNVAAWNAKWCRG